MHSAQPPQPSQLHFVDQIFEFKAQWSLHVLDSDGAGEGGGEGTGAEHSVQSPQPSQLHFLLQAVLGLAQNPLHAPCTRAGCITSHPTVILRAEAREPIVYPAERECGTNFDSCLFGHLFDRQNSFRKSGGAWT